MKAIQLVHLILHLFVKAIRTIAGGFKWKLAETSIEEAEKLEGVKINKFIPDMNSNALKK